MIRLASFLGDHPLGSVFIAQLEDGPVDLYGYQGGNPIGLATGYALNHPGGPKDEYWITAAGQTLPFAMNQYYALLKQPNLSSENEVLSWLWERRPDGVIHRYRKTSTVNWPAVPSLDFRLVDSQGTFLGYFTIRQDDRRYSEAAIIRRDRPSFKFPFTLDVGAELLPSTFGGPGSPQSRMELDMALQGYLWPVYSEMTTTLEETWYPDHLEAAARPIDRLLPLEEDVEILGPELEDGPVCLRASADEMDFFGVGHKPWGISEEWWEVPRGCRIPFNRTVFFDLDHDDERRDSIAGSALYCRNKSQNLDDLKSVHIDSERADPHRWPAKLPGASETFALIDGREIVGIYSHRKDPDAEDAYFEGIVVLDRNGYEAPLNFSCLLEHRDPDPVHESARDGLDKLKAALRAMLGVADLGPTKDYFARLVVKDD